MTIRNKLIFYFSVIVLLVSSMGVCQLVMNARYRDLSMDMLMSYSRLFFWKEVKSELKAVSSDVHEQEKIRAIIDAVQKNVNQEDSLGERTKDFVANLKRLSGLYEQSLKNNDLKTYNEIQIVSLVLMDDIDYYTSYYSSQITGMEKRSIRLGKITLGVSLALTVFTVLTAFFTVLLLFRSVVRPITILQQGTKMIGEGNFDYKINIESKDEIGQLSTSFNQMVNNLRGLQLQIVQMDRMSSIGQLAGGVAHEINNPLTGVLGQAQLLLEKMAEDDPHRYTVERIEAAAQRCRRIVRALLDFAREKNYKFQLTNVAELINETLSFTRSEMNSKKITLEEEIPDPLPDITASSGHLQQVFLNIINNAIHAMPKGGKLTISVNITDNNIMEISFTDTGTGIKKDNVDHVFDPFFTTKEVGKGTGLGLTISYGIIRRHQGEIVVKSAGEGKGSVFTVKLPININKESQDSGQLIVKNLGVKDEEIKPPVKL